MKFVITGLQRIHAGEIKTLACGVGRNMCAVDIKGDVYPCQRFVGIQEFIMGNVSNGLKGNNEFLSNIHIKNHLQCHSCWTKNLCLGHCPNENYQSTGFVNKTNYYRPRFVVGG